MWSKRTLGDLPLNVLRLRKQKDTTEKKRKRAGKYKKKREKKRKGIIAVMGYDVCFSPFSFSLCNFFETFEN